MDNIAVSSDIVGNTTANTTSTKYIPLQSTGNEEVYVSVCFGTKADVTKMKPFRVFLKAK